MASVFASERFWVDKMHYNSAERMYFEQQYKGNGNTVIGDTLVTEIAKARQHIKNSLERMDGIASLPSTPAKDVLNRLTELERENLTLKEAVADLQTASLQQEQRIRDIDNRLNLLSLNNSDISAASSKVQPLIVKLDENSGDDDGVDLFGSDSDGEVKEVARIREERLAEYAAKKAKKPQVIAKSSVVLDVKPWDDETDMKTMEQAVRNVVRNGLLWGASKLVPLAFGIHKLQISMVIEDEKVSVDDVIEEIEKNEKFVQSVDIAAFNKI